MFPTNTKALSFDCYGTLIDWETGITDALQPWVFRTKLNFDREDLLRRFGSTESLVQSEFPAMLYPAILAQTLRRLSEAAGAIATDEEQVAFGLSVPDWPAFPDSADALARLKTRFKLIILSNVDRASFATSAEKLGVAFDLVITAEDVGSYKPDPRNFERLLAEMPALGIDRGELLHVAESLYHDHGPAQSFNLPSVWINRRTDKEGSGATHPPVGVTEPDLQYASMAAFADAILAQYEATP
jgi:2-haloacid dehalogenase